MIGCEIFLQAVVVSYNQETASVNYKNKASEWKY